jgi:hypothetical protein
MPVEPEMMFFQHQRGLSPHRILPKEGGLRYRIPSVSADYEKSDRRCSCKTPPFAQSQHQAQILLSEVFCKFMGITFSYRAFFKDFNGSFPVIRYFLLFFSLFK